MLRVMVVDDEQVIADTLGAILRACGYEARVFHDAESALRACEEWSPEFVISDVMMPGMSGIDMAIELRERFPACRIVLCSGQAGTHDLLADSRARGHYFDLLTKPVQPKDVLAELTEGSGRPRRRGWKQAAAGEKKAGAGAQVLP